MDSNNQSVFDQEIKEIWKSDEQIYSGHQLINHVNDMYFLHIAAKDSTLWQNLEEPDKIAMDERAIERFYSITDMLRTEPTG